VGCNSQNHDVINDIPIMNFSGCGHAMGCTG
jgi:hypothetical protein